MGVDAMRGSGRWWWWLAPIVGLLLVALVARKEPTAPPPPATEAELRALVRDPAAVARGRALWGNCAACHGTVGQGAQGPNVRDDFWLHGGAMTDIVHSIAEGNPSRSMPSWRAYGMHRDDLHALAAYIASLQGTEDGTGKAPEGERVRAPR